MGLSVVIGVLVGLWLDDRFDTGPWLLLLFMGFGLAAGFRAVMRAIVARKTGARRCDAGRHACSAKQESSDG